MRCFAAAEDSAEARSRLTLARDLHDSVVQFLAGAAFRLEAMQALARRRAANSSPELDELKQLMLQEQRELALDHRRACAAGRWSRSTISPRTCAALAERLSRQWDINCEVTAGRRS